jgi:glycosyltransferase involved in cell wall biosynthesis
MQLDSQDNLCKRKPLLSIIVPCFNSEKYILEALNSALQIKLIPLELIIINDGSRDKTLEHIESFISQNNSTIKIQFFNEVNKGVSAARNIGIKNANGAYVGFLDSDDIFLNDFDLHILPIIQHIRPDIVEYGFKQFNDDDDINKVAYKPLQRFKGEYIIKNILTDIHAKTVWYSPIRIYKKSLWEGIQYPLGVKHSEDAMTLPKVFASANSIYYLDKPLYGYRRNSQSASSNHTAQHLKDLINYYWSITQKDQASQVFKIRLARGISFFAHELQKVDSEYLKLRVDISSVRVGFKVYKKLLLPDLFYYLFPKTYDFFNRLRLN